MGISHRPSSLSYENASKGLDNISRVSYNIDVHGDPRVTKFRHHRITTAGVKPGLAGSVTEMKRDRQPNPTGGPM